MNFSPAGMYVWDTWYWAADGKAHVFFLQRLRPNSNRTSFEADSIGHAVSEDLINWAERPIALSPGTKGSLDDLNLFTGCVYEWWDTYYIFYTMRSSINDGKVQGIGLATSEDLDNWQKYPGNPVITPDPKWYINAKAPLPNGVVDCRDLIVVKNPSGSGFYGFYAARIPGEELPETSVVATVYSEDLIHWRHMPPAFAPKKYACLEVPDVFFLNGSWYLTCLTGNWYGNRGIYTDKNIAAGTIYAISDNVYGPYRELKNDNMLMGGTNKTGYSCRSVEFEGERYLMYTQVEDTWGTLTTPKILKTTADKRLIACYSPRIEIRISSTLIDKDKIPPLKKPLPEYNRNWSAPAGNARWEKKEAVITGESRTAWHSAVFDIECESFIYCASVRLEKGCAAGLSFRTDLDKWHPGGIFAVDAEAGCVFCSETIHFANMEKRKMSIEYGHEYFLRVIAKVDQIELYMNDVLMFQFRTILPKRGRLGLFIDRGRACFNNISAVELK